MTTYLEDKAKTALETCKTGLLAIALGTVALASSQFMPKVQGYESFIRNDAEYTERIRMEAAEREGEKFVARPYEHYVSKARSEDQFARKVSGGIGCGGIGFGLLAPLFALYRRRNQRGELK